MPMIGCDCETCRSADPRDKRWRASIYVETDDGQALLVDSGPDIRAQSLAFNVRRVDAIVFTHGHADHIMSGTDFYYEPQVRLAEKLAAIAPIDGAVRTFFGNSGTEATEASIKLARYHTKRQGIIAFLGSFHGRSMGSLALTASKVIQRRGFGPLLPGVYHAPYPDPYRFKGSADQCAAECLAFIKDQLFVQLVSPDEVAAIVVEAIQGEGGYVVPPKAFLQGLRALATEHDGDDAVWCGMSGDSLTETNLHPILGVVA